MSHDHPPAVAVALPERKGPGLLVLFVSLTIACGAAAAAGAFGGDRPGSDPDRLAASYLIAVMFVTTVGVGSLAWVMLLHLTGAVWSVVIRRVIENLTRTLPWSAILFIPVALNLKHLYPWADPTRVAADHELTRKAIWLNPLAFEIRSAVYLAAWALIAAILARASARQDRDGRLARRHMTGVSAFGLVVVGLTSSMAGFDWLMSLDPHWTSTIFGVYFWAGSLVSSLATTILAVLLFRGIGWMGETVTVEHLHDLGKLLFGFVVFWTYIAFCQYFLIWYANIPEETRWYVTRRAGLWNTMSWSLVIGHFAVPFVLLLFRPSKRNPAWLGFVAAWILVFHYIDLYWLIMPAVRPEGTAPGWLDISLLLALVFSCGAIVVQAGRSRPLIPIGDPRLAESLAFRNS